MEFKQYLKRISKDSLLYGLGGAIGRFIHIFTAPIMTRIFCPADYGVMDLINTTLGFFLILAGLNIMSGVYRYYFETKTFQEKRALVSTGFIISVFSGLFILLLLFLLKPQISTYLQSKSDITRNFPLYLTIVFIRTPFSLMQTYFFGLFRLRRLVKKFVFISIVQVIINFILIILLVIILKMGLFGAFLAGTVSIVIISLLSYIFHYKFIGLQISRISSKNILSYSLPQFPAVFINWSILQMNKFFLHGYCSENQLGYYSIANKIAQFMLLAIVAFRSAWGPASVEIMQRENHKDLYNKFFKTTLIGFTLIAVLLSLYSKIIIRIIAPITYQPAYLVVVFLVFGFVIQVVNNILAIGIGISKKTKYISFAQTFVFLFTLVFNFIFIKAFMSIGAGLVILLSYISQSIFYLIFANKVYPISFSLKKNLYNFLIVFLISVSTVFLIKDLSFLHSLYIVLISNIIIFSYIWFIWLNSTDKTKLRFVFCNMLIKLNEKFSFIHHS